MYQSDKSITDFDSVMDFRELINNDYNNEDEEVDHQNEKLNIFYNSNDESSGYFNMDITLGIEIFNNLDEFNFNNNFNDDKKEIAKETEKENKIKKVEKKYKIENMEYMENNHKDKDQKIIEKKEFSKNKDKVTEEKDKKKDIFENTTKETVKDVIEKENQEFPDVLIKKNNTNTIIPRTSITKLSETQIELEKNTILTSSSKKRILRFAVCDDDTQNTSIICNLLTKISTKDPLIEIVSVGMSNGIECLYKIYSDYQKAIRYDVLLIDENMPYMSGSNCITNLMKMITGKELNKIEIISITSYEDDNIRKHMLSIGCSDIITKPINLKTLTQYVQNFSKKT